MLHKMKLNSVPFAKIKNGIKDIEMRLWDEKRRCLKVGDTIQFEENQTGERLDTRVVKLHRFPSFTALVSELPPERMGYDAAGIDRLKNGDHGMRAYYSPEDEDKYGVVGIEICLA